MSVLLFAEHSQGSFKKLYLKQLLMDMNWLNQWGQILLLFQ